MTSFHYLKGAKGWGLYTSPRGDELAVIPASPGIVDLLKDQLPTYAGTKDGPWAGLTALDDKICVFCSSSGSREQMTGALLSREEFVGQGYPLLDVLQKLGCALPMPVGGGGGLAAGLTSLESRVPLHVEPKAWAEVIALAGLLGSLMPTHRGGSILSACQKPLAGNWWAPFVVNKAGSADAAQLVVSYLLQNLLLDGQAQKSRMAALDNRLDGLAGGLTEASRSVEETSILAQRTSKSTKSLKMMTWGALLLTLGVAVWSGMNDLSKAQEGNIQRLADQIEGLETGGQGLKRQIEGVEENVQGLLSRLRALETKTAKWEETFAQSSRTVSNLNIAVQDLQKPKADPSAQMKKQISDLEVKVQRLINEAIPKPLDQN